MSMVAIKFAIKCQRSDRGLAHPSSQCDVIVAAEKLAQPVEFVRFCTVVSRFADALPSSSTVSASFQACNGKCNGKGGC